LEGKPIGLDPKKKPLKENSWFGEPKCKLGLKVLHFFIFLLFSTIFLYLCCSNFVRIEEMLCIKDIIESTQAPSFLTNYKIDMANFVDPHKVVVRRSAFLALLNAQNGGESEGGEEIGGLKHQFSQVDGDLDLQEILKLVHIPRRKHPKKRQLW
jgi:hypothetical protein